MQSEEFKTKVLPLKDALYRFARSFLMNTQESEDCVQEVFLKLWLKKESLGEVQNIKAFALQITRNLCLDKLKGMKHRMVDLENEMIGSGISPHHQLEMRDSLTYMKQIINGLPEQQRTLIHLRSVEGLEMKEISEITGMNIEHLRVTLSRARIAIKKLYEKQFGV